MALPKITLSAGINPEEGAIGTYLISLDTAAPAGGLVVNFDSAGSTATLGADYQFGAGSNLTAVTPNSFTVAAGQTGATLNVMASSDVVLDPNETVKLNLMSGTGYAMDAPFSPETDIATGSSLSSRSVSVGDFNGDGKLDLAVVNNLGSVSVLLRNAANTGFEAKADIATVPSPYSLCVGDFNGDGKLDLAVASLSDKISVLLRNAANTGFDSNVDFTAGDDYSFKSISAGDFNGDGKLDLATANIFENTVSVLMRNAANMVFKAYVNYTAGGDHIDNTDKSISVGDFNGDGKLDLAIANSGSNTVSVLLRNDANKGFDPKIDIATGTNPQSVDVGDFNGDGKLDLAIANSGSNTVSVLLRNDANTGFDPKIDIATGTNPQSVGVGDFNGDGNPDLVVANSGGGTVSVLLNNGHSSLTISDVLPVINHSPVRDFQADWAAGLEDTDYRITTPNLLYGFSDVDGDTLSITNLTATHGALNGLIFTPNANYNGVVALSYNVTDGKGGSIAATQNFSLAEVNDLPIGNISISDTTPEQNQLLTASNTLQDADGNGTISYIWKTGTTIVGTGNTYTVSANEVGKAIAVTTSYTDGLGHAESVSSLPTSAVTVPVIAATAGFIITPVAVQTTGEDGTTANYSIALKTAPLVGQNVLLTFTSSNTGEGTVATPTLTFTSNNYAIPQTLTVRGVDDYLDDGLVPYQVIVKVSTIDIFYKDLIISPLSLTNADDGLDIVLDFYGDEGGSKKDVINGGNGADTLHGLNMADNLSGGLGNDTLYGGYGGDNLFGNEGDDKLLGEQENDYLDGGTGNDTLDGGDGVDTMIGGAGNDTYILGYDAVDKIDDQGLSTDIDTVIMPYLLTSYTLPTGIENGKISEGTQASSLTGNEGNNTLTGNDGANMLIGAVGRDSLFGGVGDDVLSGGTGNDSLSGGAGKDTFTFNTTLTANTDKITDFVVADDTIQLENAIFTKLTTTGTLNANNFWKGTAPHDMNDYIIYNPTTGSVTYDSDAAGAGTGVQIAILGTNLALTNAGFLVI